MENKSIINPELYNKIKKDKIKLSTKIEYPQPLYKKLILTIKKFFISLK